MKREATGNKRLLWGALTVLFLAALTGCGGAANPSAGGESGSKEPSHDPVTLKLYNTQPLNQDDVNLLINEPLKKKYPYITVEIVDPSNNNTLQNYIASKGQLDLLTIYNGHIPSYKELDIFMDITPLAKKNGLDLNRFDPRTLEAMKAISDNGELYGIPYNIQFNALYYNKDIFDKFGVPYPKDGMTWDDVIDLGRKVARTEGGVVYRPLEPFEPRHLGSVLSLPYVDPKTNKASVRNEGWQKYFNTMKQLFEIEGNKLKAGQFGNYNMFSKDQNVAMMASRLEQISSFILAQESGLDWDMTSVPTFKDAPGTGTQVNAPFLAITPTSPYKDEAFKIIAYLLSDEVQLEHNKDGRLTVLKDENIRSQFGKNIKELVGKNIQAALALKPAKPRTFTLYDDYVVTSLADGFVSVITGQKDVNTALKDSEEATNRTIEENKR